MIKQIREKIDKKAFWLWSILLLAIVVAEIVATIMIPVAKKFLFDAIEIKVIATFMGGMWFFFGIMALFCFCQGFKFYVGHRVGLIVRNALVAVLKQKWSSRVATKSRVDNLDQRVQEDSRLATEMYIEILIEMVVSFFIVVGLVVQMWGSWLLMGLALLYSAIIMGLTYFFHRPMVDSEKQLQRSEANFRYTLASIVMDLKDRCIKSPYGVVINKYLRYIKIVMGFTLFNKLTGSLVSIVPFLILVPLFFDGGITLGAVVAGVSQFDLMVINVTILIYLYPRFTKALASHERIKEAWDALHDR